MKEKSMEREIPGGFIQVETDPNPKETGSVEEGGETHLSFHPPLPGRVLDVPPEDDEDD
jgi:hypothetical protein